jgi:hypothetical protein
MLEFDNPTPVEEPVKIGGEDYVIRVSGDAVVRYRNAVMRSQIYDENGKLARLDGLADSEPLLVSLCLFKLSKSNGQVVPMPVQLQTIRSWRPEIQARLYDKIKNDNPDIEGASTDEQLNEQLGRLQKRIADRAALKNSLVASPAGSG